MRKITKKSIERYAEYLKSEEKSAATVDKYIHDVTAFYYWLNGRQLSKAETVEYKRELAERYKPSSVNCMLSSLNSYFEFVDRRDCRVKTFKIQKQVFLSKDRELTKKEYERLLEVAYAKKDRRLYLLMQTVCSTGIRVSELRFITLSSAMSGIAVINCKGKLRQVLIPRQLCKMLLKYARDKKITSGPLFVTRTGRSLDRSNIWQEMKKLCSAADVSESKVFPHNLRHLFARTYYAVQKDIAHLADILGHSSVNTTRIYTMESGDVHRRQIERLGLLKLLIT